MSTTTPETDRPASTGHTKVQRFRCDDDQWQTFLANAKARQTTGSAVLVKTVEDYNAGCADGTIPIPEPVEG